MNWKIVKKQVNELKTELERLRLKNHKYELLE